MANVVIDCDSQNIRAKYWLGHVLYLLWPVLWPVPWPGGSMGGKFT